MISYYVIIAMLCVTYIQANNNVLSPPYTCTTTICQPGDSTEHPPPSFSGPASQGRPGKRGMAGLPGLKGNKGDPCQCDIADEEALREMRRKMDELTTENHEMSQKIRNLEAENQQMNQTMKSIVEDMMFPSSCNQNRLTDKIYPMKNQGNLEPVAFNCALYSVDEDGWITIQKRQNGDVRFYDRNWESYASGFGDKDEEFWLGLRTIHQLTSTGNYKLRIDLRIKSGSVKYAEYSTFKVASEDSKFQLTISGYSGNADDKMAYVNSHYFTTFDVDNDKYGGKNCAQHRQGAWWHNYCSYSNLNGKYDNTFEWTHGLTLSSSEMKIHPV